MDFHLMTQKKFVVRFEGENGQDEIYKITLCKYLIQGNELPVDPSIRFLCVAHPVWEIMKPYGMKKCLKIIQRGVRSVLPF